MFVLAGPPGLTAADADALFLTDAEGDARYNRQPLDGGALTADEGGATVATTAGRDTYYTLDAGSVTTPLAFTGTGPCLAVIDASSGGSITLPAGTLLMGSIPTETIFVLISVYSAAAGVRIVNISPVTVVS